MPRRKSPNRRNSIPSSQTLSAESMLPRGTAGITQSLVPSTKTKMPSGCCAPVPWELTG